MGLGEPDLHLQAAALVTMEAIIEQYRCMEPSVGRLR